MRRLMGTKTSDRTVNSMIVELASQVSPPRPKGFWKRVAEQVNAQYGTNLSKEAIRNRYSKAMTKKPQRSQQDIDKSLSHVEERAVPFPQEMPREWEKSIRALVREELLAITTVPRKIQSTPDPSEEPPIPSKIRAKDGSLKKFAGQSRNLPGTRVDTVLADLFKAEADRCGSAGKAMTGILWRAFGKPRLSFEEGEDE
jgi:hypothetical protein